jgi:hypothetical protein
MSVRYLFRLSSDFEDEDDDDVEDDGDDDDGFMENRMLAALLRDAELLLRMDFSRNLNEYVVITLRKFLSTSSCSSCNARPIKCNIFCF